MKLPLLVLGATGVVGRGVVAAAVEAARPVIAIARDPADLERLRASHAGADLSVLAGSVGGDADAAALAEAVRALGRPLAGVVAALAGGTARGRLLDQPAAALQRQLDADLLPHLAAARHLLPLLAAANRGGSYLLIGGPGGELPWAGYGHRSIAAAAQRMLARVLHDEALALAVRVQLLAVDLPVCRDRTRAHACPEWPSALDIGRRALALIDCAGSRGPAHAVVRYAPCTAADLERIGAGPALTLPSPEASAFAPPPTERRDATDATAQQPECSVAPLSARCLRDARRLLQTLLPLPR